jgi:hypothetical protein
MSEEIALDAFYSKSQKGTLNPTLMVLSSPQVITQSCLFGVENARSLTPPT